jgi:hypothetical protein
VSVATAADIAVICECGRFVDIEKDVITAVITSSEPVTLECSGRSYDGNTLANYVDVDNDHGAVTPSVHPINSLNATCHGDTTNNLINILEGGTAWAQIWETGSHDTGHGGVWILGDLMYDGMTTVVKASRPMENVTAAVNPAMGPVVNGTPTGGVCEYSFRLPLDQHGTSISWTMQYEEQEAIDNVNVINANAVAEREKKTQATNNMLSFDIPYFRCSDRKLVKVYYYLWALHLSYMTRGDMGMEVWPHTQSAAHNFLGLHRFDGTFQVVTGSWADPNRHHW